MCATTCVCSREAFQSLMLTVPSYAFPKEPPPPFCSISLVMWPRSASSLVIDHVEDTGLYDLTSVHSGGGNIRKCDAADDVATPLAIMCPVTLRCSSKSK